MNDSLDLASLVQLLHEQGPAAVEAALRELDGPAAAAALRAVTSAAHLLRPLQPSDARTDVLLSRLALHDELREPVEAYGRTRARRPRLSNRRVPAAHPALRRVLTEPDFFATVVAIAPDGTWLATGGYLGCARTWDPATGQVRAVLTGHANGVTHVAIAPDGTWLATGGADGTVRIWDAATGAARAVLAVADDAGERWVDRVAIAPDGTWLAAASHDQMVRIWDVAGGTLRATLAGPDGLVNGTAIASDGGRLTVVSYSDSARTWDTATWQEVKGHDEPVLDRDPTRAVAPDGTWVATTTEERYVRIWDAAALAAHPVETPGVVTVEPDGWLTVRDAEYTPTYVHVCAAATGEVAWTVPDRCRFGAVAPDRTWLAVLDHKKVRIWDPATGTDRAVLSGNGPLQGAAVAADGTWLAAWSYRLVELWDVATGTARSSVKTRDANVTGVRIAPDGTWMAVVTSDRKVRIVDVATGRTRKVLKGEHTRASAAVDVAPDGSWLAAASDGRTVRLFDALTGKGRVALSGHTETVTAVAISPDGTRVAAVDGDGTLLIWETTKGARLTAMRTDIMALTGCAWLPDGSGVCVAGAGLSSIYTYTE